MTELQTAPVHGVESRERGMLIGGVAAAVLAAAITGDDESGFIFCPFRRCTGAYCPGCGGTRAAGKLLRGDLVGAWHQHPYVVLAMFQSVVFGAAWLTESGRRSLRRWWLPLVIANATLMLVMWVWRISAGDIPGF